MSDSKVQGKKSFIKKSKNPSTKSKYSRVHHVHHGYASGWFNSECLSLNNNFVQKFEKTGISNNNTSPFLHNLISEALQKQQQHKHLLSSRSVVENGSNKFKRRRNCKSSASSTNYNNNNFVCSVEELIPVLGASGDNQNLSKYNECFTTTTNNSINNKKSTIYHKEPKLILEPYNRRNHDTKMSNSKTLTINENFKTEQFKSGSVMASTVFYNQLETVRFQYREPRKPKDLREHRQRTWIESPVTNLDSLISSSNKKLSNIHTTEESTSNTASAVVKPRDEFEAFENTFKDTLQNDQSNGENKNNNNNLNTNNNCKIEDKNLPVSSENIQCSIHERNPTETIMSTKVLDRKNNTPSPPSSLSNEITNANRAVTYCRYKATNENDDDDDDDNDEEESLGSDNDEEEEEQDSDNATIINPLNNVPFFDNKQFGDCEDNNNEFCEIKKFNTCTTFFKKCVNPNALNNTTLVSCDNESKNNPLLHVSEDDDQNTTTVSSSLKIFPEWIENPDGIDISYCPELKLDCLLVDKIDKPRLNVENVVKENLESIQPKKQEIEILSKELPSCLLVTDTGMELESKESIDDEYHEQNEESSSTNTIDIADQLQIEPLPLIDTILQDKNLENDHTNSLYESMESDTDDAFQMELENLRKESFKYGENEHLLADEINEHCATAICETCNSCSSFQQEEILANNINRNSNDGLNQDDTDDDESIQKLFVSPRLHQAPSSTTIILSTNYLSSTNILHSVDYEPLIDEEILEDDHDGECLFIQAGAITGTTINHHHARLNNIDDQQQQETENLPILNVVHNEIFNCYEEANFETTYDMSYSNEHNNNNNKVCIKLSGTTLNNNINVPEQQQFGKSLKFNNSQISNEGNLQQHEEKEYFKTHKPNPVKDPINFKQSDKTSTVVLDKDSSQSFFNDNQSPRPELGEHENGIIQTKLYENEAVFLWESEINANESSRSSSTTSSNDTYVVELKRQSTELTSLFSGPDNEIKLPLIQLSEKTNSTVQSRTETFEKSNNLFHRKDKKKKRVLTSKNACDMKPCCINNSKISKSKVTSHQNNNNNDNCTTTSKKLKNPPSAQNKNTILSSLLVPNFKSIDNINKSNLGSTNNCRRFRNSKIPITTKKYLESHCRKTGKEKRKVLGYFQSSPSSMGKHNVLLHSNNLVLKNAITNTTFSKSPEDSIKLLSPLDYFTENIQEPPLKLFPLQEICSVNIKNQDYPKFQCMAKIELDPFVVVRIPSFEIVNQSSHHVNCTSEDSQQLIEIGGDSNENDCYFENYYVPDLLPSSTLNANQESLKIMKEAENFLTEYRTPGSISFVEKLPQFAAFYDLLREETSNGDHRSSLTVQADSSSTAKISKKSQNVLHSRSKHKEKMTVTISRKRKFSLRKCISRRFRSIFHCCYSKRRKKSHDSKVLYSHQYNLKDF